MNNILFCSAGRRATLLKYFKQSMAGSGKIIAADLSPVAPALFVADTAYLVPRIDDANYYNKILEICDEQQVKAITTLIDPEIELLATHREDLIRRGVLPLCPAAWAARMCFNKYEMYKYLTKNGIRTTLTYNSLEEFQEGLASGKIAFPVFMKPVTGSGSVGIGRAENWAEVEERFHDGKHKYIIQELMCGGDCDADVYVDCLSHQPVSIFCKKKIESRIGGASKTISFKDSKLFDFVCKICSVLELSGPCDMDFFMKDGEYYLSEINPRFGGAYLHAYGAGVDFIKLIINNMNNIENKSIIGNYDEDVIMMMYDDVIIARKNELLSDNYPLI